MLNPLWCPFIEYIDSICRGEAHAWTKSLGLKHAAILYEMIGTVGSPGDTLEMEMFIYSSRKTLYRFLEVHGPTKLVKTVVGVLVHLKLETRSSNALHLLRSSLCANLVGPPLATQVDRRILAEISELPVALIRGKALHHNVCKDLIASLEQQFCDPEYEKQATQDKRPLQKLKKL